MFDEDVAFVCGRTEFDVAHASLFQYLLHFVLVLVAHLDDYTRIFGKEDFHEVFLFNLVQVYLESAFHIGKAHFEECRDETACRDVVSGQYQAFVHEFLDGHEGITEVFGICHRRHVVTYFVERLCESRAA